jgi:hypothetical protein
MAAEPQRTKSTIAALRSPLVGTVLERQALKSWVVSPARLDPCDRDRHRAALVGA